MKKLRQITKCVFSDDIFSHLMTSVKLYLECAGTWKFNALSISRVQSFFITASFMVNLK